MLEDQDVIFVDFDDLFDPSLFEEQMSTKFDDEHLLKLLGDSLDEKPDQEYVCISSILILTSRIILPF